MTDEKKSQIKEIILKDWENYQGEVNGENGLAVLAKDIMNGFIFGKYANDEHYNVDAIVAIIKEVELEKNPPVGPKKEEETPSEA